MTQHNDLLVEEYLAAVAGAGPDLPSHRRDDLLADLREHVASARADLSPETEAGVRTILARLGDPASIVAEARLGITPQSAPPAGPVPESGRRRISGWGIALMVVGLVVFLACAGVMLVGLAVSNKGPVEEPAPSPMSVDAVSRSPGAPDPS
jgi:uncharacterized membrane protein